MRKASQTIFDIICSRKLTFFIFFVLICHLGWQIISFRHAYELQGKQVMDARMSRALYLVYLMKGTPLEKRVEVLNNAAPYAYTFAEQFSLTEKPQWQSQITANDRVPVERILSQDFNLKGTSIRIEPHQWLNVHFRPTLMEKWIKLTFFTTLEITLIIGVLLFFWIMHCLAQSLWEFKKATKRLGIDFKITPFSIQSPLMIRGAIKAINEMQNRLENLIVGRTRILASISHDLRRPITRLFLRTQFLTDNNLRQMLSADLEEMHNMIKETLAFAKDDSSISKKSFIDLVSLLEVICDESSEIGQNVSFKTALNKFPFLGNALCLKRAFNNLINNAVRYGKKVEVELYSTQQLITITIKDDGPGIPESEMAMVFLPYCTVRNFNSENANSGTGLGLTIAHEIIINHNGNIFLSNHELGGLWVKVEFQV